MTEGFRVKRRDRKVEAKWVERFRSLPVANVSDSMHRMFAGGVPLKAIDNARADIAGAALTVKTRPGDNLILHYALDIAEPGDVIIVDAGGEHTTALMGEIMAAIALKNDVEAIVINGPIRDVNEIRRMGLPLFATGVTHRGPYKDGPGELNVPISIGGMVVEPGDLIIGDSDGVLAVPLDEVEAIYERAKAKFDAEQVELKAIERGEADREWVLEALKARGCAFQDK